MYNKLSKNSNNKVIKVAVFLMIRLILSWKIGKSLRKYVSFCLEGNCRILWLIMNS